MAATLIVVEVEGMDEPAASRIEAMLADEYSEGVVSAVADPPTRVLAVLARADSDVTVDAVIDALNGLGFQAHEADRATYAAAEAGLRSQTLTIPVAGVRDEGPSDGPGPDVPLQTLEASLDPLRSRFNEGKGEMRFITLLSPT